MTQRVLVTGGSGFIAGHCIRVLQDQGFAVRATARSPRPGFVHADLLSDDGWKAAAAGCDYVLHVASPVRPGHVANEDDLIVPAREGTLRVLRAAADAGVKRVVLTSAFHAVGFGHPHTSHVFTEDDWSVMNGPGMDAYGRSKVLAERAAWEFAAREGLELTTMLPVAVMGPVSGGSVSGANHIVQRMLAGEMPGFPDLHIPIVDVRDVASAHVAAMTAAGAAGERFLLASGPVTPMREIGAVLRSHLGAAASKVPTRDLPNMVVRLGAVFNPQLRAFAGELGYAKQISNAKARRILGWTPRPSTEAIIAAGESLAVRPTAPSARKTR
ncbi:NAD-dependent epimerase/dehydratase family protein [Actinoplanes sichuanensis]|uniref:NAD-dependent epimerase/dehydratase family protein n=1 Tax=Actinoplanes sichuanensis TaxID=512349 RepID=A0ABW4AV10_9ACTN|nr:NAD-dependent epimerase/dehydratase family protein [Actinoplanes sichuanensis]